MRTEPEKSHGSWEAYDTTPLTSIEPDSMDSSRRMAWMSDDLPEPTGPMMATSVCGWTRRLTSLSVYSVALGSQRALMLLT